MNLNLDVDQKAIEGGLNVVRPDIRQIVSLMRVLHHYTCASIEEKTIDPLMEFLYGHLNSTLQKIDDSQRACRMGCSFCCNNFVTVTTPEVLFALKSVKNQNSELVRSNTASMNQTTAGKTPAERGTMVTPCPLLENGACSIYINRPLVCRTAVSDDSALCERVYFYGSREDIPATYNHFGMKGIYGLALAGALKKAGLAANYYEYNSALDAALSANEAEFNWLSGENVFSKIAHDPEGEMFADQWNQKIFDEAFS
jgi:Fe-S-cluster containining protein